MKTVKQVFNDYKVALADVYNAQEIQAVTALVLSDILARTNGQLKAFPEIEIDETQAEKLTAIVQALKTGKPVQYILGHTDFYGLTFNVSPDVLIPRPETEELVQWIIRVANNAEKPINTILDIGTGSGCIAVTLKKYLPNTNVFAIDISKEALAMATINARLNDTCINFLQADILNFNTHIDLPQFDIIVSNPPYVTPADMLQMHKNVTDFEPHTALFVPENDPLLFYNAIADFAQERLIPGGQLFFEINEALGPDTVALMNNKGFIDVELRQDMSGRDRMIGMFK